MSMTQEQRLKEITTLLAAARIADPEPTLDLANDPLVLELEKHHASIVRLLGRREALRASLREASGELKAAYAESHVCVVALRSFLRARLGPGSAKLLRFGIPPLGSQSRGSGREPAVYRRAS